MEMEYAEACKKIKDYAEKKLKSNNPKSKFYFNDLSAILEMKPRPAKTIINQMITEGFLEFWSSGSTTMYGVKGLSGKQASAEGEE
jgi:hypothetical protein